MGQSGMLLSLGGRLAMALVIIALLALTMLWGMAA